MIKKAIRLFLLIGIVGILVACGVDQNQEQDKDNGYLSFENYYEIANLRFPSTVIDASLNNDNLYITDGNSSLKVTFESSVDTSSTVIFYMPTIRSSKYDYSDFTKVQSVSLDVYNDTELEIEVQLMPTYISRTVTRTGAQKYVVAAKSWKTVEYVVNPLEIDFSIDVKNVTHLAVSTTATNGYVYYDNAKVTTTRANFKSLILDYAPNEVVSFEKGYQYNPGSSFGNSGSDFTAEIVNDPYLASEGFRFLKLSRPAVSTHNWIRYQISPKLLQNSPAFQKKLETDYFAFDIKKTWDDSWSNIVARFVSSQWGSYANKSFNLPSGQNWQTIYISVNDLITGFDTFEISMQTNYPNFETVFYIDNIRITSQVPVNGIELR